LASAFLPGAKPGGLVKKGINIRERFLMQVFKRCKGINIILFLYHDFRSGLEMRWEVKLLEMSSFFTWHIFLEVGKHKVYQVKSDRLLEMDNAVKLEYVWEPRLKIFYFSIKRLYHHYLSIRNLTQMFI
jgi:hypothetical protein